MFGIDDAAAIAGGVGLLNFIGGQSTNEANRDIAAQNNQWSAQQYATRYQTQVADLKAAGLNPALAYGASPGQAPTAQQVQFQNPVASATHAATDVYSSAGKFKHDVASAGAAEKMQSQIEASTDKIREEIKNIPDQGSVLRQTAQMLTAQSTLMAQQGATQQSIRAVNQATIENLHRDGLLKDLDISAAIKFDNFGREYKQYAPAVDLLKAILMPRSGGITINK